MRFLVIFFFLGTFEVVFSQITTPKYANEFMSIGVGARALAMGSVQSAIANDVTAGYWNPAGLIHQTNTYNTALMHSELYAGIAKNDYFAFSMPFDDSSYFGVSVIRTGVDNIPNTLKLMENGVINYDNISLFSVADWGVLFSYARNSKLIPGLKVGVNAKVIYRNVGPFANAWGFGFDGGAQLNRKNWKLGLVVRDATTTATVWSINSALLEEAFILTDNELPANSTELTMPRIIGGAARNFKLNEKLNVLAAADIDFTTDGKRNTLVRTGVFSVDPHLGAELNYKGFLFARTGINTVQQLKDFDDSKFWVMQPNFGIGFKVTNLTVDYALTKVSTGDQGLFSHVVSLRLNFDELPKAK